MFRKLFVLATLATSVSPIAQAGTLRVGVPQVEGNQVVLPVMLEGDVAGGVAALDFTLNYDPRVFTPVGAEASAAAQSARKQVESNEVSPGNYVVMMFGMNQTTVANGQVASITLNKHTQPTSNQSDVSIQQTTFASLDGFEIASEGSSQTVTFPAPPSDGAGNGDPPPPDNTPPPVVTPGETPTPSPEPPVTTPPTPPPTVPGVPGGTPHQPDPPTDNAPRATPMVVATSSVGTPAVQDSAVGSVARMNRAAQRLENSRAALSQSTHIDSDTSGEQDADAEKDDAQNGPASVSADSQSPGETLGAAKVASAPAASAQVNAGGGRTAESSENESPDSSGIPPASRRILMIVAAAIAVSMIVYRFARRSAR
jgi:hypothetical protein